MTVLLLITLLIIVPAAAALLSDRSLTPQLVITRAFGIGAPIVYTRQEMSANPCAEARDICPSERGEFYYYNLVNYLRVTEVLDDGRVIAVARDNNRLCFWADDSQFRKARLTERLILRWRFPRA